MNNKGFIHTLEAIIAILLLLSILFVSISLIKPEYDAIPIEIELLQKNILDEIQNNEEYRIYLLNNNELLIEEFLNSRIGEDISFSFDICDSPSLSGCSSSNELLQNKNIYSESIIIREERDGGDEYIIFRLYLWYI